MLIRTTEIQEKLDNLKQWFSKLEGCIVAFSGGTDSSLVLYLAHKFLRKDKVIGVISNSESLKTKDYKIAEDFCSKYNIQLITIKTKELQEEQYHTNPVDRCFFCKNLILQEIKQVAVQYPSFNVLSGTNYDDLSDYRPGNKANELNGILSPLVDCKITKAELREIAKHVGLPNWNKPASPCLATRIPYGQTITNEKMRQIESAEYILNDYGFDNVRVRHYGSLAKIEVQTKDLPELRVIEHEVISKIKALGFTHCEIDDEGMVSGKMNRAISDDKKAKTYTQTKD